MEISPARAYDLLVETGRSVQVVHSDELLLDGRAFNVKVRAHPTPADLRRETERLARRRPGVALIYVVPRVSPALAAAARELPDVVLLALDDRALIQSGVSETIGAARGLPSLPPPPRRPWGRFAVMRALVQHPGRHRQTDLAAATGISQAGVSKALRTLGPVADETRAGSRVAAEELWSDFLDQYPGANGITSNWYSLDPPARQAKDVLTGHPSALSSGDAGADEIAPWRVVRRAVVYTPVGIDLSPLGYAEADPADSTLTVVVPADRTVFATARAWNAHHGDRSTADPMIVAQDVRRIGGPDAEEAIDVLRKRVFEAWR